MNGKEETKKVAEKDFSLLRKNTGSAKMVEKNESKGGSRNAGQEDDQPQISGKNSAQQEEINGVQLAEPKIGYIKAHFSDFPKEVYQEVVQLYNAYIKLQRERGKKGKVSDVILPDVTSDDILSLFEKGGEAYFTAAGASPFCCEVRNVIMEFEEKHMECEKPLLRDWLWEQCHEQLFCIKWVCKRAAQLKNDVFLINFINDVKDLSEEATFPSSYHAFKNNLRALNEDRRNGKCRAIQSMNIDENVMAQREHLIKENMELRNKVTKLISEMREDNKRQIATWKEELKSEIVSELENKNVQPSICSIL